MASRKKKGDVASEKARIPLERPGSRGGSSLLKEGWDRVWANKRRGRCGSASVASSNQERGVQPAKNLLPKQVSSAQVANQAA